MGNMCFCVAKVRTSVVGCSVGLSMSSLRTFNNINTAFVFPGSYPVVRKNNSFRAFRVDNSLAAMPSVDCATVLGMRPLVVTSINQIIKRRTVERFQFTKGGCLKHGLVKIRGKNSLKKNSVLTTNGPPGLSLETSSGQVSGDGGQDEDGGTGSPFPRAGNSPSPRAGSGHIKDVNVTGGDSTQVAMMAELEDALGFPLGQDPQSPSPKPLVIVISGPSGVGKDAVIKHLQHARRDIHFVVTATTRMMRPGEVDGVDYFFMSKTEFQEMIENQELLEHAIVYGDYKGIPKQQVRECINQGMDVVLRVDVQGAATVRSILGSEAVFIFLVAESEVALAKRLIERKTETMDKLLVRVATAREELTRMEEFDYVVVNAEGYLDNTVSLICSIIDAEKARVKPKAAQLL